MTMYYQYGTKVQQIMEQFRNLGIFDNIIICREAFRRILNIPNEIYIDYKPHISTKFINRNIPHS